MINYLAIDWGRAKIGVALAHAETRIAVPYGIWPVDEKLPDILREIVHLEEIGLIILGDPEHEKNSSMPEITLFREGLLTLGVEVVLVNEMFTSKMAQANRKEADKRYQVAYDDAEAARIMLTDYLDKTT
jgi:RNase H-fold protein (predicted Holliday junction resolvase)